MHSAAHTHLQPLFCSLLQLKQVRRRRWLACCGVHCAPWLLQEQLHQAQPNAPVLCVRA